MNNLKEITASKKEIQLEIPAKDLTKEIDKVTNDYVKKVKIKGFRPGKTPKDVVKRMYYAEIKESVINALIPRVLSEQLKHHDLNPAGSPLISDIHFQEGDPLKVTVQVEVWPEFDLPDYSKQKVKKPLSEVTEKDIDQALDDLRSRSAQYIPTQKRGVADGDYVVVEVKGQDITTKKYLPSEKVVVLANHPDNEKTLNEHLIGLMQGEESQFSVQYEEDYKIKRLAGKNISYSIKVESIKEKVLPEINDDFAKDLGEFENLDSLKNKIREELQINNKSNQRKETAEEVLDNIIQKTKIEIPESIIQQESLQILQRLLSSKPQQDMGKKDMESLKEQAKSQAEKTVKNHLILKKISEKENIQISEKEIQDELKNIAKLNNVPLSQIIESINKEGRRDNLKENLLMRKTVDFLVDKAII